MGMLSQIRLRDGRGDFIRRSAISLIFLKRSDQARWYALVGAVGLDDENTFAVIKSENGSVTMRRSGMLYFYANDKKGRYYNNQGSLVLEMVRVK
jgi:hypothetical protein